MQKKLNHKQSVASNFAVSSIFLQVYLKQTKELHEEAKYLKEKVCEVMVADPLSPLVTGDYWEKYIQPKLDSFESKCAVWREAMVEQGLLNRATCFPLRGTVNEIAGILSLIIKDLYSGEQIIELKMKQGRGEKGQEASDKAKTKKKRKKTPPQILKETRERQAAKELAKNPNITAEKLGKILGCDKSTIVRLTAWKKKNLLNSNLPDGFIERNEDGGTSIEAIAPDK